MAADKLDLALRHELAVLRRAAAGPEAGPPRLGPRRVRVRFTGDPADLRSAGLRVEDVLGDFATGIADLADLDRLAAVGHVASVQDAPVTRPLLHTSVPAIHADQASIGALGLTGQGVVVGIVDTGIDVFHKTFRNRDAKATTRILALWDHTLKPAGDEKHPDGYQYGVEFTDGMINAALEADKPPFRSVDTGGHGTHVAGIAAGNGAAGDCAHPFGDYYIGVAPQATLIVVKLDTVAPTYPIVDAVQYIIDKARHLPQPMPVVVNISEGHETTWGAHAGADPLETGLDGLLGGPGVAIVVSGGNTGDKGIHAQAQVGPSASHTFHVTVDPGELGQEFDIWYSSAARLTLTLTSPTGVHYQALGPGTTLPASSKPLAPVPPGTKPSDAVSGSARLAASPGGFNQIRFKMAPLPGATSVTAGTVDTPWLLEVKESAGATADVHVWISYDHYSEKTTTQFIPADRVVASTVHAPATARHVISVGAYDSGDGTLASFSSRGPIAFLDPNATGADSKKPDICAPGVNIWSARSRDRSFKFGECCLRYISLSGTSMAAPHVTGVVALMLQQNGALTAADVLQRLRTSALPPKVPPTPPLPSNEWGSGMVDALRACTPPPGGGSPLGSAPFPASPMAYRTPAARLRALERRFGGWPLWHELGALVSTHFDEVSRLIASNRRVATAWRRLDAPELLARLATTAGAPLLPPAVNGRPIGSLLERWLAVLERYGSAALRADVTRSRALVLALPDTIPPGMP